MAPRRCPICGATHATCGAPWVGTPVDIITRPEKAEGSEMGPGLARYVDDQGNMFSMTAADAQRAGYTLAPPPKKAAPPETAAAGTTTTRSSRTAPEDKAAGSTPPTDETPPA